MKQLDFSTAEAGFIASALMVGIDDESHEEADYEAGKRLYDALCETGAETVTIIVLSGQPTQADRLRIAAGRCAEAGEHKMAVVLRAKAAQER